MARKSLAATMAVKPLPASRVAAPSDFSKVEAEEWDKIMASLPASHFRPSDISLFREYVKAAAICRRMTAKVEADGDFAFTSRGQLMAHPAHAVMSANRAVMAQLAVKLRLCPSSRVDKSAASLQKVESTLSKPWETHQA